MRRIALTLAAIAALTAPAAARERLARVIGRAQGLPTSQVMAIVQDGDGFLWLGTAGGLVRWDGARAVHWAPDQILGTVSRLAATPDGSVWAAEEGGALWRVDGEHAQEVPGLTALTDLRSDGDGGLWVAAHEGLAHLPPDGDWEAPRTIDGAHVWKLGLLGDGTAIAATADAAYRLDSGAKLVALPYIVSVRQADNGDLWIATDGAPPSAVTGQRAPGT
jgi:ligand-binding sensor domain-containing protein